MFTSSSIPERQWRGELKLNFHIWLLLEEHVEQLTGWCNPIRPHSYVCYHHSALRGEGNQVNTSTQTHYTHTTLIPHLLFTSLTRQTCQQGVQPKSAWLTAWQHTTVCCKKDRQPPSRHACMYINTHIFSLLLQLTAYRSLRHNRYATEATDILKCR